MHHEVTALGGADQASDRGLPFLEILLNLRQLLDVESSVAQRDQVLARSFDGIANLQSHDIGLRKPQGQLPVRTEVAVDECLYR